MTEFAIYVSAPAAATTTPSLPAAPATRPILLPPSLVMFAIAAEETSTASRFL